MWSKIYGNVLMPTLARLRRSNELKYFRELERSQWYSREELKEVQRRKLHALLKHVYEHVPYYHKLFKMSGVIDPSGQPDIEKFHQIPFLTKDIIRASFDILKSDDIFKRKWYINNTGGSTGEPLEFIQDNTYNDWNIANKKRFFKWAGRNIGDRQLILWGSERDLFAGTIGAKAKIINFLSCKKLLNAFKMSPENMAKYVKEINKFKPTQIFAYVEPMYELAKFIDNKKMEVYSPKAIMTSAGTLYPDMREEIEKIFRCKVFNKYGTREMGDIACQCDDGTDLHISSETHIVEVVDKNGEPREPGECGELVVTSLTNYSMPFIRYKIGDIGILSDSNCPCGRGLPLLEKIEGRVTDTFITKRNELIPAEYFIHLIGVVCSKGWISKFQVIQEDFDKIRVKIVKNGEIEENNLAEIKEKIKLVMGEDTDIEFEFVSQIKRPPSGKYRYTISKVYKN